MPIRKYIIKSNLKSPTYNCVSCDKEMSIPLLECLYCSNEADLKMRKKMESTDPFFVSPKKSIKLTEETRDDIIRYFIQLVKDGIVSSRRASVFYINKKFRLNLMYWQIHKILSPNNLKLHVNDT